MDANTILDEESGFTPKMALCLAAITLVGIDGEFKEEELEKLRSLIHADETAFLKAFSFYNDRPLDVCLNIVAARLNDKQKQTTYRILYDLARSDKDLAECEENLLNQYAVAFGLNEEFLASISASPCREYDLSVFA